MRTPFLVIGLLLLIAGGLIATGMISFNKEETLAKLGSMELTTTHQKKPAPVLGYLLLGAGALALAIAISAKK